MTLSLDNQSFSDALVILGAAGLVIPLFARFRVTPVIGFILVGVLVGPHGLGSLTDRSPWLYYVTISDAEAIEPFAEFGIILLLFSIGLELSFRRLWTMRRLVFGVGAAELIGSGAIIAVGLALMGQGMAGAIGLGLALALSSTALVLPMVGTRSPVGKAAFSMLLFEDVAIVPIIFALGVMAPSASNGWSDLGETVLRAGIAVVGLYIVGKFLIPRMFAQAARTKSPEVFLAASLLVVIVSSLVTTAAGLSPIVGALLAGLLIAESAYADEVEAMTAPFKGLALGVFLITVGMSVDLAVIAANWQVLALAIVTVIVVKTTRHQRVVAHRRGPDRHRRRSRPADVEPVRNDVDRPRRRRTGAAYPARNSAILGDRHRDRPHHHADSRADRPRCVAPARMARRWPW